MGVSGKAPRADQSDPDHGWFAGTNCFLNFTRMTYSPFEGAGASTLGEPPAVLRFNPRTLIPYLAGVIIVLVIGDLFGLWSTFHWGRSRLLGLIPMFRLDFERNVPTFFAMLLLLSCGLLTALRARVMAGISKRQMWAWLGLTAAFTFVAIDEFFELHERLVVPVRETFNTSGILHFAWVIPYGLAVMMLGLLYLRFFMRLEPTFRRRLFTSAAVFLSGAMGMEMVGGAYLDGDEARRNFTYGIITMVEETLELTGSLLAIRAFIYGFGIDEVRMTLAGPGNEGRRVGKRAAGEEVNVASAAQ